MSDYHKRIMNFNNVRKFLIDKMDYSKEYIFDTKHTDSSSRKKYNNLTNLIKSVELSETQGKFSETYTGFINNVPVLIKILPYNKSNKSRIYYNSEYNNESDPQYIQKIDLENKILKDLLVFVTVNNFLPTYSLIYWTTIIKNYKFKNKYLKYKQNNNSIIFIMELYDITLKKWMLTKYIKYDNEEKEKKILNILFYIWISIGYLYYNMRFIHNDLHWDNIMLKYNDNNKGYFIYNINNIDYYIPNEGFSLFIIDYGKMKSLDKYTKDEKDQLWAHDLKRIHSLYYWVQNKLDLKRNEIFPPVIDHILNKINNDDKYLSGGVSELFILSFCRQYMHNMIGKKSTTKKYKKCTNLNQINVNDIIIYQNKYCLISNIHINKVSLIIESKNLINNNDDYFIKDVLYTDIKIPNEKIMQKTSGEYKYLNGKPIKKYKLYLNTAIDKILYFDIN